MPENQKVAQTILSEETKGFNSKSTLFTILWSLIVLNLFDIYSTNILVSKAGLEMELNPLMRSLMNIFGVLPALIIFKSIFISLTIIIFIISKNNKKNRLILIRIFGAITLVYLFTMIFANLSSILLN
jgi:Domain of unknown function (DUF5658)